MSVDNEWLQFKEDQKTGFENVKEKKKKIITVFPKCSEIYISTQTKIAYLNQEVDLNKIFWSIPIIDYHQPKNGVIKKSIKINSSSKKELDKLQAIINSKKNVFVTQISSIKSVNKFKDVKKIDVGLCQKDIISYRKKQKGAFYNCFALIIRIFYKEKFREVHVKIFNTGKLEIPGIQYDELLILTLDTLVNILQPLITKNISYNKNDVNTVLINSNFSCGYYLNRFKLFQKLKYSYKILSSYDTCSYPGIQSLFWYNKFNSKHDGIYNENNIDMIKKYPEYNKHWNKISFMIFRTGSVLIVGNCDKNILNIVYNFVKKILEDEIEDIFVSINNTKKKIPTKKVRKKVLKIVI